MSEDYKIYLDERRAQHNLIADQSQLFDKSIITLASAALALSLTAAKDAFPNAEETTNIYIVVSWILFAFTILSTLVSFMVSQKANQKYVDYLDVRFDENSDKEKCAKKSYQRWNAAVISLNIWSLTTFVLGMCSFGFFAIRNI